jgi:GT2 family glycosyltransferase
MDEYRFRYVLEKRPGLDRARNTGIVESNAEIIAFIDDDAIADPEWLNGLACAFACPDTVCATGLVLPSELETVSQELFEVYYGGFGRGFRRRNMTPDAAWKYAPYWLSVGTGCNMAFRREVFDRVGLFDVALDVGTPTGGAGDLDMFHRVVRAGYTIAYRPEALVYHRHRTGADELQKLLCNYGKSFTAFLTKCFIHEPEERFLLLRFVVRWYSLWFVKRFLRQIRYRNVMPVRLILTEAVGALGGAGAYFRSLRWSKLIEDSYPDREMCKGAN